jgi:hypothetical protein
MSILRRHQHDAYVAISTAAGQHPAADPTTLGATAGDSTTCRPPGSIGTIFVSAEHGDRSSGALA